VHWVLSALHTAHWAFKCQVQQSIVCGPGMSAPRSFRNLHMYLYMYMLYLVCDLTKVLFMVSKRSFIPENCLFCRQKETLVLQVWCCRRIGVVWMLDTFKLSCVLLWTFSTWCTQRICLLNPCQPKKWAKHYRLMVSACQTCIPKGSMMTPTTRYDSAWDLHTEYSTLKLKVFSVLKSQNRRIKL